MEFTKLGNTEIKISKLTFGAWAIGGWMWGGVEEQSAERAIHCAIDHGITLIDTAPAYGFGRSEEIVGRALKGHRDAVARKLADERFVSRAKPEVVERERARLREIEERLKKLEQGVGDIG